MNSTKLLALCFGALAAVAVAAALYLRHTSPPEPETMAAQPAASPGQAASRPSHTRGAPDMVPAATPESGTLPGLEPKPNLPALVKAITDTPIDATTRALTEDLLHGEAAKRANAISELGFLDDPRWVPVVIAVLGHDRDPLVRSAAAAALATQSTSPAAAHALSTALTDQDEGVRQDALLSLKALRNSTVEQDLRRQLASNQLDEDTARETRIFLDRYYVRKDPLYDPLDP